MARRLAILVLMVALLAGMGRPVMAQPSDCVGLAAFEVELTEIGEQWLQETSAAGVAYTADPTRFDAADWTSFAELARDKGERLAGIDAPVWLAAWLDVQVNAAELQGAAADAAAAGGIPALMTYGDDFVRLLHRDEDATAAGVAHCAAFAEVAQGWAAQIRDFEPQEATPVAGVGLASR